MERPLSSAVLKRDLDPLIVGPEVYRSIIKIRTVILGMVLPIFTITYKLLGLPSALIALALTITAYFTSPSLYRSIMASELDREIVALLLYILPFSWSPRSVADVFASLASWKKAPFKWSSKEALRLTTLLNMGKDPLSALGRLAETTPSKKLKEVLEIIVDTSRAGISKERTIESLASTTVEEIRSSWKNYTELAQIAAESSIALMLSIAVIVPIASMAGSALWLLQLPLLISIVFTVLLLVYQPTLGLNYSSSWIRFVPLVLVLVTTALLNENILYSIALLALFSIAIEVLWRRRSLNFKRALGNFRRAVDKARLGLPIVEELEKSRPLLGDVISAMVEAVKVAGTVGVWRIMDKVYGALREAIRSASEARSSSYILMAVSIMAPAMALYIVKAILSIGNGSPMAIGMEGMSLEATKWILLSTPLSVMPASVLHRPRMPSLVPSLIAMLVSLLVIAKLALIPL